MQATESNPFFDPAAAPKQARSRRTLNKLLETAEALIAEQGSADVAVAEIARRAESSVGGFYARFPDKDALLLALFERYLKRGQVKTAKFLPTLVGLDLCETVRRLVAQLVHDYSDERVLVTAFVRASVQNPDRWSKAIAFRQELVAQGVALGLGLHGEISHPKPERAVSFAAQTVYAVLDAHFLHSDASAEQTMSDEELIEEVTRLVTRYLGVSSER